MLDSCNAVAAAGRPHWLAAADMCPVLGPLNAVGPQSYAGRCTYKQEVSTAAQDPASPPARGRAFAQRLCWPRRRNRDCGRRARRKRRPRARLMPRPRCLVCRRSKGDRRIRLAVSGRGSPPSRVPKPRCVSVPEPPRRRARQQRRPAARPPRPHPSRRAHPFRTAAGRPLRAGPRLCQARRAAGHLDRRRRPGCEVS